MDINYNKSSLTEKLIYETYNINTEYSTDNERSITIHGSSGLYVPIVYESLVKYSDTPDNTKVDDININTWRAIYNIIWCCGEYTELETKWYKTLIELYSDFDNIKKSGDIEKINNRKQSILELGWNPELPFNAKNLKYAKEKTNKLAYDQTIISIDLTKDMNNINANFFEELSKSKLCPVFIILSFTDTVFGKMVKSFTNAQYSHAAIGIDKNLDQIYSFNGDNSVNILGGFSIESIEDYKKKCPNGDLYIAAVFVTKVQLEKIKTTINYYIDNIHDTKYDFMNIINIIFNRSITNRKTLNMICSQFVSAMLRIADVSFNKFDNLITPQDFRDISNKYIYTLYEGPLKDYNRNIIKNNINKISSPELFTQDNGIISEITSEVDSTIQFDTEGNLIIKTALDIEKEYQDAHRLLLLYDDNNNIDGMKYEIARLYYLSHRADDLLASRLVKDKAKIRSTRARILNDYNKYLNVILQNDPDFIATEYYKTTPYYDYEIKIKKTTIDYIIQYAKDIAKL